MFKQADSESSKVTAHVRVALVKRVAEKLNLALEFMKNTKRYSIEGKWYPTFHNKRGCEVHGTFVIGNNKIEEIKARFKEDELSLGEGKEIANSKDGSQANKKEYHVKLNFKTCQRFAEKYKIVAIENSPANRVVKKLNEILATLHEKDDEGFQDRWQVCSDGTSVKFHFSMNPEKLALYDKAFGKYGFAITQFGEDSQSGDFCYKFGMSGDDVVALDLRFGIENKGLTQLNVATNVAKKLNEQFNSFRETKQSMTGCLSVSKINNEEWKVDGQLRGAGKDIDAFKKTLEQNSALQGCMTNEPKNRLEFEISGNNLFVVYQQLTDEKNITDQQQTNASSIPTPSRSI